MRKDNTQNYQTTNTKIQHFKDFSNNIGREKEDLEKIKRSFSDNEDQVHNLPNLTKMKYNLVSNKMDNLSQDQVDDKIKSIKDEVGEKPDHKYKFSNDEVNPNHFFKNNTDVVESKILKSFESFLSSFVDDVSIPKFNRTSELNNEVEEDEIENTGCGCCDECSGSSDCNCCDNCDCENSDTEVEYEYKGELKSYMFFGNIETIHRQTEELMQYDETSVNNHLNDGHNWAEDHISVAKELISQVYNFLSNKGLNEHISVTGVEHGGGENYMFFANLETISRLCSDILEMDHEMIDELLENGHDWAEDHIAAAKEDVQQVYEFIKTEL